MLSLLGCRFNRLKPLPKKSAPNETDSTPFMKTYLDSGVLIMAFRAEAVASLRAMQILDDANREFVTSPFVKLETLPKAQYQQQQEEVAFYETYFKAVRIWVEDMAQILPVAHEVASQYGLAAMDALHVAAALTAKAEEIITTEKATKPMHRVAGIRVVSLLS